MNRELRVLMLEDTPTDAELAERELHKAGIAFTSIRVETRDAFSRALEEFHPDIVLSDYKLPDFNGMAALEIVRRDHPEVPVVMVTGALSDIEAVELIHAGARDYVLKDRLARLAPAVQRALSAEQGARARKAAEKALRESLTRYTTLAESANDAIICIRPDGSIELWNKMAQQMFGYSAEEAIGKPLHQLITPEHYRSQADQGLVQFGRTGTGALVGKSIELIAMRRDGTEFPIELSVSAMNIEGGWYATGIIRDITERKEAERERLASAERLEQSLLQTIEAIAAIVEVRDPYTAGHQRRVAALARAIAQEMGLPDDEIRGLYLAATIHDLGKISIPAEILSKPTQLSQVEFELVKTHPQAGHDIIKDVQFPWPIAQMVLQHHERLDGSGYPQGLNGGQILIGARILSVADVVEAMSSHRPYRPGLGLDAALEEIIRQRGVLYDPGAVDCCLALFREKNYVFPDDARHELSMRAAR